VVNRILQLPFTYLKSIIKSPLLALLPMIIILYGGVNIFNPFVSWQGWLKLAFILFFGAVSYVATMWLLDRKFMRQTLKLIKEAIS
jgi:hypothetical protein